MKTQTDGHSSAGFSLAELMVGLFLMSLGALAAAPLFGYAMHGNAASRDLTRVGVAAERRLEILRQMEYDDLNVGGSVDADTTGYFETTDVDIVVRWQIASNSGVIPGTKILTVRAFRTRIGPGPAGQITTITLRGD